MPSNINIYSIYSIVYIYLYLNTYLYINIYLLDSLTLRSLTSGQMGKSNASVEDRTAEREQRKEYHLSQARGLREGRFQRGSSRI